MTARKDTLEKEFSLALHGTFKRFTLNDMKEDFENCQPYLDENVVKDIYTQMRPLLETRIKEEFKDIVESHNLAEKLTRLDSYTQSTRNGEKQRAVPSDVIRDDVISAKQERIAVLRAQLQQIRNGNEDLKVKVMKKRQEVDKVAGSLQMQFESIQQATACVR